MYGTQVRHIAGRLYRRYVTYLTVTPILVTVAIIIASFIIAGLIQRNLATVQSQTIDKQLKENQLLIQGNFDSYAQIVWSGIGRLNSGPIDRTSWSQFIGTYQLQKRFPAISSVAVTRVVGPDEQQAYLQTLSDQYGQPITVTNNVPGQPVNIVSYVSPERPTSINNIGFNSMAEPARQTAMQKATDTNDVVMTEQLQLYVNAKESKTSDETAFLLYAPYYKPGMALETSAERQAAIQGHVSASFRTQNVFDRAFSRIDHNHTAIQVHIGDATQTQLAYSSPAKQSIGPKIQRTQTLQVFSQTFTINYDFDSDFLVSRTQLRAPTYMVIFGVMIGMLIGTATFFFLRGRYHRLLLDKEHDVTRAKDELLSLASHQLRTPATGVKQYMGMVLQGFAGKITPIQEELLEKAYKSNERQLHVINDILHLAKLDLGRIVLAKSNFDLSVLVRDVIDEQQHDINDGQLTLKAQLRRSSPIYADEHMLRMVIENIISNAVKYTDPGGKVWVRLQQKEDGYFVIVKDTGVGIASRDMPLLFQQFSRLMNSRSHLVSGTGVGLYLARHLIELHNGVIDVESTVGKGSTFTIYIPIEKL
jgi:signal transduction histidine kinase